MYHLSCDDAEMQQICDTSVVDILLFPSMFALVCITELEKSRGDKNSGQDLSFVLGTLFLAIHYIWANCYYLRGGGGLRPLHSDNNNTMLLFLRHRNKVQPLSAYFLWWELRQGGRLGK